MKRTFAVVGFSYMLGLILMNYIPEIDRIALLTVSGILLGLSFIIKPVRRQAELPVALISIILSVIIFTAVNTGIYAPAVEYAETKCQISAEILDYPTESSSGNYCYPIRTQTINGENKKIDMLLYVPYDICAEPYDSVSFSSYPFVIGENEESYYRYFRAKGTYLGAYTKYDLFVSRNESKPFISAFTSFKGRSTQILKDFLREEKAGFACGILFGDKVLLSDDTLSDFSASGASHILAVSGLHMSVWVFGLFALLKKFNAKEKTAGIVCIGISLALVCLASFSPSVMRSAIMTTVYFSSLLFSRRADALNSLGTAVFFLCLFNPFIVCDISFLMTVFATLGIILSSKVLNRLRFILKNRKGGKAISYILTAFILSLSANLFVFPVTVNVFGTISLFGWLTNLLVVPILAPCMFMCGLLVAYPSVTAVASPLAWVLDKIIGYILGCVRLIADIPYSFVETQGVIICKALPVVIALIIFLIYNIREKRLSVASLACFLGICIVTL